MKYRLLGLLLLAAAACAGQDPEFPSKPVFYFSARQGVNSSFDSTPDHYVGGLSLTPQFALIPGILRGGFTGELSYTDKHLRALAGPRISLKLKTFSVNSLGSLFNLQIQLEHLWGSRKERLAGAGLALELFQCLELQIAAHRDHYHERWWFRSGAGWNILHKKRKSPTGADPMSDAR